MKEKRRKSRKTKKWRNIRSILAIIGVLFALFNIFLVSKIKSAKDQEFQGTGYKLTTFSNFFSLLSSKVFQPVEGLPHLEINYSQLRDFSDIDLSIKPHKRVCK